MHSDFSFSNGVFSPIPDPLGASEGEGYDETLRRNGYSISQTVGNDCGLSYTLYTSDDKGFLVLFQTACRGCLIVCDTFPDLIELLAKLSPIALAALISEDDIDAIDEALRPYHEAVYRRQRKKS